MKNLVTIVLLLAAPTVSAGDLKINIALAIADLGTTEVILAQGGREVNPLMSDNRAARITVKAVSVVGVYAIAGKLEKRGRPTPAKTLKVILIVVQAFAIAHNLQQILR